MPIPFYHDIAYLINKLHLILIHIFVGIFYNFKLNLNHHLLIQSARHVNIYLPEFRDRDLLESQWKVHR